MQKTRNQQSISLLLLIPVLIPLLFIVCTDLGKWRIKLQRHERLKESSSLVQIKIHEDEVQWMDKHEIAVQGKMFDIQSRELKNGFYYFTGHFDDQETGLQKKQQSAHTNSQQSIVQLFKSLQQLYFDPLRAAIFLPDAEKTVVPRGKNFLLTAYLDVTTPPPQAYDPYPCS